MSKNSSATPLVIGGVAFLAWYFWTRAAALQSLIFIPRGLGVQGAGISLQIGVQNPTGAALALNSLFGSLLIQGQPVGNVSDIQPQLIAPNSESVITVLVTPNLFGIAAGVIDQLDGNEGTRKFSAAMQATANINGIPVPVNLQFT
jgi:hypothetical protein